MESLQYVAFDADDTLWVNEPIFVRIQERCAELLGDFIEDSARFEAELYARERENLKLFGYGVKGFILSVIETCIELSDYRLHARQIQQVIDWGKEMLTQPVKLLDHVAFAIDALENYYQLLVITKGDLFDQENKLARSGIADRFHYVEIVSEKDPATYRRILEQYQIPPESFLMIGNSLRSDILPVLELGAQAIHVPFQQTWAHEQVAKHQLDGHTYLEAKSLREATEWLLDGRVVI